MVITKQFYVGFHQADEDLYMKNSAILSAFGDIAGFHAERAGEIFGVSDVRWLLTGYRVDVHERPRYGMDLVVSTWSRDYKNVTATREFEIHNQAGKLLVTGLSNWARVNIHTQKLVKLSPGEMAPYASEPDRTNFGPSRLPRLAEPETFTRRETARIDWRWIDMNGHMNNGYYLDLAEHILPPETRRTVRGGFSVAFRQQIFEGDEILCLAEERPDGVTVVFKSADGETVHAVVAYDGKAK